MFPSTSLECILVPGFLREYPAPSDQGADRMFAYDSIGIQELPMRRRFPRTTFSAVFVLHFWSNPICCRSIDSTTSRQ
jgi:hypothetical protein